MLSVIMCNYNYGVYIKEAIDGVVSQSVLPQELIIIDDASTDNSLEIIQPYIERYPWIQLHKNKSNLGACKSGQIGLNMARGKYIYWNSSDDRILPEFFEKTIHLLEVYQEAGLCCSVPCFFQEPQRWFEYQAERCVNLKESTYITPHMLRALRRQGFWIAGHTTIFRKDCVLQCGGIIESLGHLCDWFLSQAIAYRYGLVYIPQELATLRKHAQAMSSREINHLGRYEAFIRFLDRSEYADVKKDMLSFTALKWQRSHFIKALRQCKRITRVLLLLVIYDWISKLNFAKFIKSKCCGIRHLVNH